jgi:hypothetical protein
MASPRLEDICEIPARSAQWVELLGSLKMRLRLAPEALGAARNYLQRNSGLFDGWAEGRDPLQDPPLFVRKTSLERLLSPASATPLPVLISEIAREIKGDRFGTMFRGRTQSWTRAREWN